MINLPFQFDFYHFGSDTACGDTIERLPILDWNGWYNPKHFEFKRPKEGRANFTGAYNRIVYASFTLFRRQYCLRIDFGFGTTTPDLAYREYHDRIKLNRAKQEQK